MGDACFNPSGVFPQLEVTPLFDVDYTGSNVPIGDASGVFPFTIRNAGDGRLCLLSPALEGMHPGDFDLSTDCMPRPGPEAEAGFVFLESGGRLECTANVRFTPQDRDRRSARLRVSSDSSVIRVNLSGTAIPGTFNPLPPPICLPRTGAEFSGRITLTNAGPGRLRVDSASLGAVGRVDGFVPAAPPVQIPAGAAFSFVARVDALGPYQLAVSGNGDPTLFELTVVAQETCP
jgi:hypothetical protein